MTDIYYNLDGVTVRKMKQEDVDFLKDKLRKSDVDEVWASHCHTAEEALQLSLEKSSLALTIDDNGTPVGCFGINPDQAMGNRAVIWFLSSDAIENIKLRFVRNSKIFVNLFLSEYPLLFNFVDCRNSESLKWLEYIGAQFGATVEVGVDKMPFKYFSFEAKL